jgi:hypothetical protein
MDNDRDLLPWIFGGLSMATVAIALTVGSTNSTAPRTSQEPTQPAAHILSQAATTALAPMTAPAASAPVLAAQIQPVAPPTEPSVQIWQCMINGQKTFSDNPCGEKSSVHEIGPINRMDPTPILPRARPYVAEPSYPPEYAYQGGQEDSSPGEQRFSYPYPVFLGIPRHQGERRDHERGRPDQERGMPNQAGDRPGIALHPYGHYRGRPLPRN